MERVSGVEPPSHPWQGRIITTIRHPPTLASFGGAMPAKKAKATIFPSLCAEERNRTFDHCFFRAVLYH